jgi:hypothetical protein
MDVFDSDFAVTALDDPTAFLCRYATPWRPHAQVKRLLIIPLLMY